MNAFTPRPSTRTAGDLSPQRRYRVVYLRDGRECASPWFASRDRALQARDVIQAQHGPAVLLID